VSIMDAIRRQGLKSEIPEFSVGDTLKVHVRVVEGQKTRTQIFQGTVLARRGSGIEESFTVRKVSSGIPVERVFPLHSPNVQRVEVVKRGRVRQSKLNYLKGRIGKSARIAEKRPHKKEADKAGS
jgi:large subunit ribosomal protein L19